MTKEPTDISEYRDTETVEQIGKDVVVGTKEVRYEDGRNVISVIINAISVRINMPRGTVKLLMACFAVLVVAALIYAANVFHSWKADERVAVPETEEQAAEEEPVKAEEPAAGDDVLALKDYVNISSHYYYQLPENIEEVWTPDELYAANETFCDFTHDGNYYSVRSYMLDYRDEDLAEIVKGDLSLFDNMSFLDEEYVDGKYGEMLKLRFETAEDDGSPVSVTGYYWYDSSPEICCLEIASDEWREDGVAEMIKDSVYRVSSGTTAPYAINENAWEDAQQEEAMNSLAEDAMRDSYEQKPDISDRIIKP